MSNTIIIKPDGPLVLQGDLLLEDAAGNILSEESELYLCRCGHSKNAPYCDGSHKDVSFEDSAKFTDEKAEELAGDEPLVISVRENAMLIVNGPMTITNPDSTSTTTRNKAALCRCGHSNKKPFCDASHKHCGFTG